MCSPQDTHWPLFSGAVVLRSMTLAPAHVQFPNEELPRGLSDPSGQGIVTFPSKEKVCSGVSVHFGGLPGKPGGGVVQIYPLWA